MEVTLLAIALPLLSDMPSLPHPLTLIHAGLHD
jgi:hypothetical protein